MKDKNNLTPCEYARNKLNIIIGQYSSNGEELNSLLSFQSKIIDEINSDEKFNIGLQKDDTIKNIIMNCFYLFNEFIWLNNQNDTIKDLFEDKAKDKGYETPKIEKAWSKYRMELNEL